MRVKLHCCMVPVIRLLRRFSLRESAKSCYYWDKSNPLRELWRLRLNFFVLLVLSFMGGIGYSSVLSSLHQFVTNPTLEKLNGTGKFPPGLGHTEFFYSWTITIYSIGEVIMAPIAGYSTRIIPYWYILATGVLLHIFGYVIYAVASSGWMLLLARLLTGGVSGIIETIAFAYVSERECEYKNAYLQLLQQDLRKTQRKVRLPNIKEKTFTYLTLSLTLAYLLGPGMSALIAQFPSVNQFRWVGWFSVALGAVAFFLLITLFHAASYVMDSSYGVVDTLFNPILSDYFGFTEKETSYFFVGVMVVHIAGSLLLLLLNLLRINTRIIAMIGVTTSIVGAALIADWQAIGHDPCTQFSPFHTSEPPKFTFESQTINSSFKLQVLNSTFELQSSFDQPARREINMESNVYTLPAPTDNIQLCQSLDFHEDNIYSQIHSIFGPLTTKNTSVLESELDPDIRMRSGTVSIPQLHCTRSSITPGETCPRCSDQNDIDSTGCIMFKLSSRGLCFLMHARGRVSNLSTTDTFSVCEAIRYPMSVCISARNSASVLLSEFKQFKRAVMLLTEAVIEHNAQHMDAAGEEDATVVNPEPTDSGEGGENVTAANPEPTDSGEGGENVTAANPEPTESGEGGENVTAANPEPTDSGGGGENATVVNPEPTESGEGGENATAANPEPTGSGGGGERRIEDNTTSSDLYLPAQPQDLCETLSPRKYGCYWNQHSRVTGEVCFECPPICRSKFKSLDFFQYCVGVAVFVLAIPISRIVLMVLISDSLSRKDQGPFTGIVVSAGGISRAISPIWIDAAYEGVQKRTFLPMAIKIVIFLPVLVGLIALYRLLAPPEPKQLTNEKSELEEPSMEEENDSKHEDESEHLLDESDSKS